MNNLKSVIDGLKASKIKERQEALQALKTTFSDDRVIANLGSDRKTWLPIYQALFTAMTIEKDAFRKARQKTGKSAPEATITRRLEDIAKTVRWLVERTTEILSSKVLSALYDHLTGILVLERGLFKPVALDYLKALKHIASYRPHLDHMDDETWIRCVEICFNVVLGDSIRKRFVNDEEEASEQASNVPSGSDTDSGRQRTAKKNSKKRALLTDDEDELPVPQQPKGRRQKISVELEQVECASLLSSLLRSTNSPITSPDYPYLPSAILKRLRRFLETYPSESSLLYDYLISVSLTLDHLALNAVNDVRSFAQGTWKGFVDLWGVKDKRLKEELVIIIRSLLPFIIAEQPVGGRALEAGFDPAQGLLDLWNALDGEAENRWGVNGLKLNSIRLELMEPGNPCSLDVGDNPFVATTFRSGWNFDSSQALSWAILELHADCAKELFQLSERTHGTTPRSRGRGKRAKMFNPIAGLINSIHDPNITSQVRCYRLQALLFFIDRHWSVLHETLKHDLVHNTLLNHMTSSDEDTQTWVFLSLAAIAFAERFWVEENPHLLSASQQLEVMNATTWDGVWNYAVRRASVPGLCRAACHLAHALLVSLFRFAPPSGHIFLTSQQVLSEIETIGKDLDVQGPSYPFDSVCMFLSKCLRIAAQDVRLYRLQLEDKVCQWLADAWTVTGDTRDAPLLNTVSDVLLLLETVSGFSKQYDLVSRTALPVSPIVDSMKMEKRVDVIRSFLLFARLAPSNSNKTANTLTQEAPPQNHSPDATRAEPTARERRISSFLKRMLDALIVDWEARTTNSGHPSIEIARRALDFAVTALAFECTLTINSTQSHQAVLKNSGKLLASVISFSKSSRWTIAEKMLLILGIESLAATSCPVGDLPWDGISAPDHENDGIMRSSTRQDRYDYLEALKHRRSPLLEAIWKSHDLEKPLKDISDTIRSIVEAASSAQDSTGEATEVDDHDGFGPIRTAASAATPNVLLADNGLLHGLFEVYIPVLSRGPYLQSSPSSRQPTRDRHLIDRITEAADKNTKWFIMVAPLLLREIEMGALECNAKQLSGLLVAVGELLTLHAYSRNQALQTMVVYLLHATLSLWAIPGTIIDQDMQGCISDILGWLSQTAHSGKLKAWKTRDAFLQLLEKYVNSDPAESQWQIEHEIAPMDILLQFVQDEDIRIRFRTGVVLPHVFVTSETSRQNLDGVYDDIKDHFSQDLDQYEQMATRFLSLANFMVVSSAVRRAPYWHLLETHQFSSMYSRHIEASLKAVVGRLGLPSLASLFEAYAFQLATAIVQQQKDFLAIPPFLLGYEDRKQAAGAALRAFVPAYIMMGRSKDLESHCRLVGKSDRDAARECFGDIVGFFAAGWFDRSPNGSDEDMEEGLKRFLQTEDASFDADFQSNIDGITASILQTLGDQDYSAEGPINMAILVAEPSGKASKVFAILTRYRHLHTFKPHQPNLPIFSAASLVRSLTWLSRRSQETLGKATIYHVMHDLFSRIQKTPLINEKCRLINALCMWIALGHDDLADATLLHTLLHGATSLLAQPDLARSAQSILEWTFRSYRKLKAADKRLSRILVRICAIAHDYSTEQQDSAVSRLGKDLSKWIDEQALLLSEVPVVKPVISRALPAWPRDPSQALTESCSDIQLEQLSEVLQDEYISSNKFRIVRRLKGHLSSREIDFESRAFWRLKECIPPSQKLREEDAIAFTDLLIQNYGRINSLTAEQPLLHSIRTRQIRLAVANKKIAGEEIILYGRDAIIHGLIMLLEDESPTLVYAAYSTLRLMISTLPATVAQLQTWSPEHRAEVDLLRAYPRQLRIHADRSLSPLITSEYYIELCSNFPQWVTTMATFIADILASRHSSFGQLNQILSTDISTAEEVLPVLVLCLLQSELGDATETKSKDVLSEYFAKILTLPSASLATVKCIVEIVTHLRYFLKNKSILSCNRWLDLNFLLLAKNAVRCGAYTTALLFLELAAESGAFSSADSASAEQIQYEIYAHIDEPDGFYGIQTQNLHQFLIQRLHHEQQWDKAFRFHGAMLEAHSANPTAEDMSGLLHSFHSFGFNRLAIRTLQLSDTRAVSNETAMSYKLGWRSETWDLPDRDAYTPGAPLYNAIRAIYRERNSRTVDSFLTRSLYKEMDRLRSLGIESISEIRGVLQSLMCLNQLFRWNNETMTQSQQANAVDISHMSDFTLISPEFEFSDLENIMSTRIALVRSIRQKERQHEIGNIVAPFVEGLLELEKKCLLSLSKAAREADQTQIALNSIVRARSVGATSSAEISEEYANVLWSMKEPKLAVVYLNDMLKQTQVDSNQLRANLLSRLGTWTSEACLEKPTEIWQKYFIPAEKAMQGFVSSDANDAAVVCHLSAEFADKQYHTIITSPEMLRRKVYIERKTREIEERQRSMSQMRAGTTEYINENRAQNDAIKLLTNDRQTHKEQMAAHDEFLKQAIDLYSQSLSLSDAFDDDAPIKLSSLWFANFDDEVVKGRTLRDALDRVPSHKFIFLAHQILARITNARVPTQEKNQEQLQKLVMRICQEHPFHTLYHLYCLRTYQNAETNTQSQTTSQTLRDRSIAAEDVLGRLREDSAIGSRVRDVERICAAYVEWANEPIEKPSGKGQKSHPSIPSKMKILTLSKLKVPVLTARTEIDPTLRYNDCVWIARYSSKYNTAGGVNLPKISTCYGSDGMEYKQLFKGKDDMRQDAVMEQVFALVNKVLSADRETSKRSLKVRGYKVIPLAAQAGVLEFVNDTKPLREWLLHGHRIYRPKDMDFTEASKRINAVSKSTVEERLKVYNFVRSRFQPVFRHFFTEKHKNPMAWFATRLRYTRSVATTSIVGHVLGLGDRHTSNILLDNSTGEVVHIDLGIAFDQGRLLPIPELVPFRLTRDIVDGMGISGTQGVFQRCAEETLRVLREGSDIIMTVLEVFKYDPLHSWTLTDLKIEKGGQNLPQQRTPINEHDRFNRDIGIGMSSSSSEEAADRALSSVARKLDKSLSVESTVSGLIAEATDVQNLAVIFHGWGPQF
ncbi:hypothetical protein H1R20_g142, partial [Candolleomyces eurysporus]